DSLDPEPPAGLYAPRRDLPTVCDEDLGEHAELYDSISARVCPMFTSSPFLTWIFLTLPPTSAVIAISVFIDCRTRRVSPAETAAPSETLTWTTSPAVGARISLETKVTDSCSSPRSLAYSRLEVPFEPPAELYRLVVR